MKKTLCLLLALLMSLSVVLVACNDAGDTSSADTSAEASVEGDPDALVPHLGQTKEYAGTLNILASAGETKDTFPAFVKEALEAEELTDEPVNDATYERNQRLKEEYGIELNVTWEGGFNTYLTKVRDDKATGQDNYDVLITGVQTLGTLAAEDSLLDLYSIEDSFLELEESWWDGSANKEMSVANKLYFTTGDIVMMDDEHTRCIVYNLDIHKNNNLENPASLVKNQEWTLEAFYNMAKAAAVPSSNGDFMPQSDCVYGSVMAAFDTYTFVVAHGCPMVEKDDDDIPYLAVLEQRNYNAFTNVYNTILQNQECEYTEKHGLKWNDTTVTQKFYDGKALFFVTTIGTVNGEKMRNAELNYGILPIPKGTDDQEDYVTPINPYWFTCVAINKNCENTDFVTFALEAMAYTAKKTITPAYYELTLQSKRALEDPDAWEMLDILFSHRVVDASVIYNWDDCIQYYNRCLTTGGDGLTSLVESQIDKFNAKMNETIENFR